MQYLLSVHSVEGDSAPEPEAIQQMYKDVAVFNQEIMESGAFVFGGGLLPSSSATTVRSDNGEVVMTDGPFAETKEQLGGFWVVKANDLDAALALGAAASAACQNAVEVRPFQDEPEA